MYLRTRFLFFFNFLFSCSKTDKIKKFFEVG